MPPAKRGHAMDCLSSALRGEPAVFEFSPDRDSRPLRHFECRYLPNTGGQVLTIIRDITARKETDARIHRLAYFDALTGLPNREWIRDYLCRPWRRRGAGIAAWLCYTSIWINSSASTTRWDTAQAMRYCAKWPSGCKARWIRSAASAQGQIARLGGDEFMVVLTGVTDPLQAEQAARPF